MRLSTSKMKGLSGMSGSTVELSVIRPLQIRRSRCRLIIPTRKYDVIYREISIPTTSYRHGNGQSDGYRTGDDLPLQDGTDSGKRRAADRCRRLSAAGAL